MRDHRTIEVANVAPDPLIAKALDVNSKALQVLSSREQNREARLKKRALEISSAALKFLGEERIKTNAIPEPTRSTSKDDAERQR